MNRAIPRDPLLPPLATALDEAAMATVFDRAIRRAGGPAVRQCSIDRVKYRPRRSLSVAYRLTLAEPGGAEVEQWVGARFVPQAEAAQRHARALARARHPTAAGPALVHEPALGMVAHLVPNDPKLPALARLVHGSALTLPGWIVLSSTIAQYVPEHRVTARVLAQAQDAAPGTARTLYVKADAHGSGARTDALMRALGSVAAARDGRLWLSQPLAWQAAEGLQWQLGAPGQPLLGHAEAHSPTRAAQVGTLLAALHTADVAVDLPRTDLAALRQRLADVRDHLWFLDSALQPRIDQLVAHAEAALPALAALPAVVLHGDLHPGNLLVDGPRLWLIDLDAAHRGAPLLDVAGWLADRILRDVLDGSGGSAASRAATDAFVDSYARQVPWRVDGALLAAATVYQLLCERIYRCAANLKPGRTERIPELIAHALALAARAPQRAAA